MADFQQEYGLRLSTVVDEWSPAEVLALVEVLPPTSRFVAHVLGGEDWRDHWGWGRDRHMFADWINTYVAAHTPKGKKTWEYPRPADKKALPRGAGSFRALMGMDWG